MYQEGNTPLHCAAEKGHTAIVDTLLAHGADAKAVAKTGWTPLHYAADEGHTAIVHALLSKGADAKAVEIVQGHTPLHYAAGGGHNAIVDTLLAHGADAKAENNSGKTPLHDAAAIGRNAIVDTLLAHGADAKAVSNSGTPRCTLRRQEARRDRRRAAKRAPTRRQRPAMATRRPNGPRPTSTRCSSQRSTPRLPRRRREAEKAFEEATTVHVLSTRFNEPSKEVLAKWFKANGIKKKKNEETDYEEVECDTDDEDGEYRDAPIQRRRPRRQSASSRRARRCHIHPSSPSSPWSPARAWSSTRIRPTRT